MKSTLKRKALSLLITAATAGTFFSVAGVATASAQCCGGCGVYSSCYSPCNYGCGCSNSNSYNSLVNYSHTETTNYSTSVNSAYADNNYGGSYGNGIY